MRVAATGGDGIYSLGKWRGRMSVLCALRLGHVLRPGQEGVLEFGEASIALLDEGDEPVLSALWENLLGQCEETTILVIAYGTVSEFRIKRDWSHEEERACDVVDVLRFIHINSGA